MTQLATQPDVRKTASRYERTIKNYNDRQVAIDKIIEDRRASLSPVQLRKLKQKRDRIRLRISDLNEMAIAAMKRGVDPVNEADDRSSAVRFIDLIDLPRNTTANILFGEAPGVGEVLGSIGLGTTFGAIGGAIGGGIVGALLGPLGVVGGVVAGAKIGAGAVGGVTAASQLAAAAARPMIFNERTQVELATRARRGALGQPSIYFSDALEKMGVENKPARMILGLAGDVLLDPLTYLGGANAVTWMSRTGARVAIKAPTSRMLNDISKRIAMTGALPTDAAYSPFIPLWQKTIQIGDELIDISGAGSGLRERLLEAAQRVNQIADPQTAKGRQRVIAQLLREDILESARLGAVHPALQEKLALTQGFLDRFTAKSDFALTIPGAGFLANRLRRPLDGRSFDLEVGGIGRAGKFHRDLAETRRLMDDAGFTADLSRRVAGFQNAREGAFNLSMKEAIAGAEIGSLEKAVKSAVPMADTHLDVALRDLEKLTPEVNLARENVAEAAERIKILRGPKGESIYARVMPLLDGMDDFHGSMARGDSATAALGPSAMYRAVYGGTLKNRHDAEIRRNAANLEHKTLDRSTVVQKRQIDDEIEKAAPGGVRATAAADADEAIRRLDAEESRLLAAQDQLNKAYAGKIPPPAVSRLDIPEPPPLIAQADDVVKHKYVIGKGDDAIAAAAMEGRKIISHGGKVNTVDVRFAGKLDSILWLAGETVQRGNAVAAAAKRQAIEYLQRVYGVKRSTITGAARRMHKSVQEYIEQGIRGRTAGASVAEGERAFNMPLSKLAQRRAKLTEVKTATKKGALRLTKQGLFRTTPGKVKAQQKLIDQALTALRLQRNSIAQSKSEIESLVESLKRIEDSFEASATAFRKVADDNARIVDEIENSTLYRTFQKVMDVEDSIRKTFNIGRRSLDQKSIAKLRREIERLAPMRAEKFMRAMRSDFDAVLKELPGSNPGEVQAAWLATMEQMILSNSKQARAFARDPTTGRAFDDVLTAAEELKKTETGRAMLENPNVRRLAEKHLSYFKEDLQIQQSLGILADVDPELLYVNLALTEKARIAMLDLARRLGETFGGTKAGLTIAPGYTYRKVTNRLFYGPGENDFIWMGELANLRHGDTSNPFEAWRQNELRLHPELRRPGDIWDATGGKDGIKDGEHWIPKDRIYNTSALHLNNHRGDFLKRVGSDVVGPLFEEDLLLSISRRVLVGERTKSIKRFMDEVVQFAKPLSPDEARLLPKGVRSGTVVINGLEYKVLSSPGPNQTGLFVPLPDEMRKYYFPSAFVDTFNDWDKTLRSYSEVGPILKGADEVLSAWKFFTLMHPSWMVTNQVGGAFASAAVAKTNPVQWIRYTKQTLPMILEIHGLRVFGRLAPEGTRDHLPHTIGGIVKSRGEWKEIMQNQGIANAGRTIAEITTAVRLGGGMAEGLVDKAAKFKKIMPLLGKWFQYNAAADDQWRAITYFSRVEMGDAAEAAREIMVKAHFEYADLSFAESIIGTRVWPFARWMRNNVALQARMFVERPMIAASFPKLKNALEEAFDAEQLVPEELRPRWIKDNIGVQLSSRPEAKFALLSIFTPIQELIEAGQMVMGGEGFEEALKYAVSSASPLIKAPMELAYGQELFTGREIGDPDEGKMSRMKYLAMQFRPFRESYKMAELSRRDVGALDYVTRIVFGGRVQQATDEKLESSASFQFGETTRTIRKQIIRAVKENDLDDAERLSVKLIEEYRRIWKVGLYEQIPKELRRQFARESK